LKARRECFFILGPDTVQTVVTYVSEHFRLFAAKRAAKYPHLAFLCH
jgi:hypothetical protein